MPTDPTPADPALEPTASPAPEQGFPGPLDPSTGEPLVPDARERYLESHEEAAAVPVRPAATVMLVRDGEPDPETGATLEVCMLRRNLRSTFVGGVHVFPGGAVDPADGEPSITSRCDGWSAEQVADAGGLAFWVAAIRETFEEAGLLPAQAAADEQPLRFDHDGAVAERFLRHRRAVDSGERTLAEVLTEEGLRLDLSGTHYVSRWVTPFGLTRRYDTRFFVAAAPAGQAIVHDGRETIEAEWHRPAHMLARHEAGAVVMRIPTVVSLQWLAGPATVAEALAAAATLPEVPVFDGSPRALGSDATGPAGPG